MLNNKIKNESKQSEISKFDHENQNNLLNINNHNVSKINENELKLYNNNLNKINSNNQEN